LRAIVVGAGFGGLAAALRLRALGYDVTVIERGSAAGGRAAVFEREGFRHDAGPTVITAPFLLEELFALFGERLEDHVQLVPLTPWYRFHFADGSRFDYGGTVEETLAEIRKFNPPDAAGYLGLLEQSRRIYDVGFSELAGVPFHNAATMLRQLPALLRLGAWRSVWQMVCRYLKDDRLRQAFSIQPLLVGGNPFATTSIYSLIHYLERAHGVHFAMGGTGRLVEALVELAVRHDVRFRYNATVDEVLVDGRRATGVALADGTRLTADIVVSNADAPFLHRHLLRRSGSGLLARLKRRHARYSMGLFVLYFGTTRRYSDVAHHTIWLGARYEALLKEIFEGQSLPEDFSLYVHRPTATDASFAPAGCDSFYVLCPVPNLKADIDWDTAGPQLAQRIIDALHASMLPGLKDCITAQFHRTPANFKSDYLSEHGAGFSIAPVLRQSAWFRFHNKAEGLDGLYLVGAGTHPGAGLPGVLCSAKVIESLLCSTPG
jgi:phytoene desaturase